MKMTTLNACGWLVAVAAGVVLPAAAGASNFSYTFVEGSYGSVSVDDPEGDFDGDAWAVSGAWQFHDHVFVYGGYEYGDYDFDVTTDTFEVGVGFPFPVSSRVDLVGGASYVDVSADAPFVGSFDDSGYSLFAGLRAQVAEPFQVEAGVSYVDLDDSGDDTAYSIAGRYYFTKSWAVGAGYSTADDADTWSVSIRWEMPR